MSSTEKKLSVESVIKSKEWSRTPLGPYESWPQEIKVAVNMALCCPFPQYVTYGEDHLAIYNDGYADILGHRHPEALGQPIHKIWSYLEQELKELFDGVYRTGESVFREDTLRPVRNNGVEEERYFTLAINPLRAVDDTNRILGCILTAYETTAKVFTQRRLIEAQDESRREKEKLHSLLTQAPIAIGIVEGEDFRYVLSNDMNNKLLGKKIRVGAKLEDELPHFKETGFLNVVEQVYRTGIPFVGTEVQSPFQDDIDKERYFNFVFNPYTNSKNQIEGVMAVGTEVTDLVLSRRRAMETQHRYRTLAESLPQMVWTISADGHVIYANKNLLDFTGVRDQESYEKDWSETIHPEDLERVASAWEMSVKASEPYECEYRVRRADGEYHWFLVRGVPHRDSSGKIQYWIGSGTNIEDQKRNSQELEDARDVAEKANATKSAFLANMSHEIRTPLGAILGYSELLKDRSISNHEYHQYLDTIIRNGKSLTRLIDDILDLAKVEAGRLEVEQITFSLNELFSEVHDLLIERAVQKNIKLELKFEGELPGHLASDPTRIRQILINIIGNAIKFTSRGGVTVFVRTLPHADGRVEVQVDVRDTGPGITVEQKARLFSPFTQADNTTTRQYGGTGLGLALSKRLSEALGGGITIFDNPEETGSVFRIYFVAKLPSGVSNAKSRSELREREVSTTLKGLHVLVVDDSIDNQMLVKHLLSRQGASVELAGDGQEAIEKAMNSHHDVVLMDLQMPRMDGYQSSRELRALGYRVPIVALTAHAMIEEREKTRAAGFTGHLTKPIDVAELVSTVLNVTH